MRAFLGAILTVALLGYPFAVYAGLTHLPPRRVSLLVVAAVVVFTLAKLASRKSADAWSILRLPLGIVALAGLGAVSGDPAFLLALPVLTNLVLLAEFAGSLAGPVPLVERFARLQHADLTPDERRHCRSVTIVWSGFFVLNGLACAALALLGPLHLWTLYTGVLAYVAMGALFAVEYLYRKIRFGRFGPHLHDRMLERLTRALRRGAVGP